MNTLVEMMNQSTARIGKIAEGDYNEFIMKTARRGFGMQIEILNTALRGYRSASKNKRMADTFQKMNILDGMSLIDLGLGDSEIENVTKHIIEKLDEGSKLMKKITENRSMIELEEALREYKLQSRLFNTVIRHQKLHPKMTIDE